MVVSKEKKGFTLITNVKFTDYYCKNETLEMKYDNSLKHKANNIYFHLYIYIDMFFFFLL